MQKAASTADILGFSSKPRIPKKWAAHYNKLCALRDQFSGISRVEMESVHTDDVADAGSAEIDRNLELATQRATLETLGEVLAAIRRIEQGSYGVCEYTGEEIEPARLEATPWVRFSLTGQSSFEKTCGNRHARLGNLRDAITETEVADEEAEEQPKEAAAD